MSKNIQAESCKNFCYDESGLPIDAYGCKLCLRYKGHECMGDCPSFTYSARLRKDEKVRLEKYIARGKQIAEEKYAKDGKSHVVCVILSEWKDYFFGHKIHHERWLSLIVDDTREEGGKLGVGKQLYLADFHWPKVVKGEGKTEGEAV